MNMPNYYVNVFLGLVFVCTALLRMLYKKERQQESRSVFYFPKYSDYFILGFELVAGVLLLLQYTFVLYFMLAFLVGACCLILFHHAHHLKKTFHNLFTFQPTATAFFLHITYILMVLYSIIG